MNIGFPEASVSFNRGQDILYRQFNDIDVYVEDAGKERLYFQLFKNLLPGINLAKIFSLGGKNNVTSEAAINSADKRKIYLVDLDFDGILGRKKNIRNLIYLHRYSIENYFIEEQTIKEQIRERKPSISDAEIASKFDYTEEVRKIAQYLYKPALVAILVQKFGFVVPYPSITMYDYKSYCISGGAYASTIDSIYTQVESKLKTIDGRYTLAAKIKEEKADIKGVNPLDLIPGKWLLIIIKDLLLERKLIYQKSEESFSYALAKDVDVKDLEFIKNEIARIRS